MIKHLLMLAAICVAALSTLGAVNTATHSPVDSILFLDGQVIATKDFMDYSAKQHKAETGERLGYWGKLVLRKTQKKWQALLAEERARGLQPILEETKTRYNKGWFYIGSLLSVFAIVLALLTFNPNSIRGAAWGAWTMLPALLGIIVGFFLIMAALLSLMVNLFT